jgi:hypothetical protein
MMLTQIRGYLIRRGCASLEDIALHVEADAQAVRGMLRLWLDRGFVSVERKTQRCGVGCNQCAQETTEIYHWIEGRTSAKSLSFPKC